MLKDTFKNLLSLKRGKMFLNHLIERSMRWLQLYDFIFT